MNLLDEIFRRKRALAKDRQGLLAEFRARALDAPPPRGFRAALASAERPVALIAEVKRASPTQGPLRDSLNPAALAREYESAGAHALSVLTDREYFQGCTEDLVEARSACGLPILRKDFTVAELDVFEARAMGADAILLIVNGLSSGELVDLSEISRSMGMDVLVEAHSEEDVETALRIGADLVGVNNRDLQSFETDLSIGERLLPRLVGHALPVAESAIRTHEDVERLGSAGARAVLIGSTFCRAPQPGAKVLEVMGW